MLLMAAATPCPSRCLCKTLPSFALVLLLLSLPSHCRLKPLRFFYFTFEAIPWPILQKSILSFWTFSNSLFYLLSWSFQQMPRTWASHAENSLEKAGQRQSLWTRGLSYFCLSYSNSQQLQQQQQQRKLVFELVQCYMIKQIKHKTCNY